MQAVLTLQLLNQEQLSPSNNAWLENDTPYQVNELRLQTNSNNSFALVVDNEQVILNDQDTILVAKAMLLLVKIHQNQFITSADTSSAPPTYAHAAFTAHNNLNGNILTELGIDATRNSNLANATPSLNQLPQGSTQLAPIDMLDEYWRETQASMEDIACIQSVPSHNFQPPVDHKRQPGLLTNLFRKLI